MSRARGSNNDGPSNEYEKQKLANIERNKRRLAALNISALVNSVAQPSRPKKISKKKHNTNIGTTVHPNLRPRSQRNYAQHEEELVSDDLQSVGDFLNDNEDPHINDTNNGTQQRNKGRGITKKDDIFSRTPDILKIQILFNDRGQPVEHKHG